MRGRRRSARAAGLAPDFEDCGYVAEEDAGHLAPFINLGDAGGTLLMFDRDFVEREPVAMRARDEFPPEAFLHFAEFLRHDLSDRVAHEDVRAARVVHGGAKDCLIEQVEEAGEDAANERIGAVHSPADDDIGGVAGVPKLLEVVRIALAVGVEAEKILGLAHLHAFPHCLRIAFARIAQVEADGKLGSQRAQNLFGVIFAAVFANDESNVGDARELGVHSAHGRFDALAFVMDR